MSEDERIRRLLKRFDVRERLIVAGGDDAAVAQPQMPISVTSVDAVVEGVHFTLPEWPLRAVAHKAVAAALSDLAAMGASPGEVYVAAGLPSELTESDFDELVGGLADAADAAGAVVAGGDLSGSATLWLSITVVGYAESSAAVVTRSGARAGDLIVVTGELGGARRALDLIGPDSVADDPRLARQFAPRPQLDAGVALAAAGATAMIDVSDGLLQDAGRIAERSAVQLVIDAERLPLAEGVEDPAWAAASGEEYELLATIPAERLEQAHRRLSGSGATITTIGIVSEGAGARLVDAAGADLEARGFDHFD